MEDQEKTNDLYVKVRGINIPRFQVTQIEEEHGAKIVPDEDWRTLLYLDAALKKFRTNNENRDPEFIILADRPGFRYKHMVMNINFLGMTIPSSYTKPAWFYWSRKF